MPKHHYGENELEKEPENAAPTDDVTVGFNAKIAEVAEPDKPQPEEAKFEPDCIACPLRHTELYDALPLIFGTVALAYVVGLATGAYMSPAVIVSES